MRNVSLLLLDKDDEQRVEGRLIEIEDAKEMTRNHVKRYNVCIDFGDRKNVSGNQSQNA
jgi:hypothetical protein